MADVTIYQNLNDEDCVAWTDESGSHSMLKSTYDAQQEAMANYVPTVVGEGDTK
jgi:hypothetical protein